jgi:hypothetical protein
MPDIHDRSFYLALADAEARAAKKAPSREMAEIHLQAHARYREQALALTDGLPEGDPQN